MNKKVLTLCAGFLLAGGLTVPAFAETFEGVAKDAANLENQYYRVRVQEVSQQSRMQAQAFIVHYPVKLKNFPDFQLGIIFVKCLQ